MSLPNHDTTKLNPIALWLRNHVQAFLFALGELIRTPFASLMTLMVIGVAIALPVGFYLLLQNFQSISTHWRGNPSVSLYLNPQVTIQQIKPLVTKLQQQQNIASVEYISPDQGLKEFEQMTHFSGALSTLSSNPLPGVIVVTPTLSQQSLASLQQLATQLQKLSLVNSAQLDMAWVKRLFYIVSLGRRITYAIAIVFCVGLILIIGNTIRLTTERHRQDFVVLELVGATSAFIRRPLLYRGLFYGTIGGAIALLLVTIFLWWLKPPAQALAKTYTQSLVLHSFSTATSFYILVLCAFIGLAGSWLAVQKHLISPKNS